MATLIAPVRLHPTTAQMALLRETMLRTNAARTWVAERARAERCYSRSGLCRLAYHDTRQRFDLGSKITVEAINSVVHCYRRDKRRSHRFRPTASIPIGTGLYSFKAGDIISIWTVGGRQKIPFTCGERERALLANNRGQATLKRRPDGRWMLSIPVTIDTPAAYAADGWLGVDLGVKNIATTSDGAQHSGSHINGLRRRNRRIRGRLQAKQTRSARRRLHNRSGYEARFARDVNHQLSKQIVRQAERTGQGIALEDLTGIHDRVRARRPQRDALHAWAFAQLRQFITYKAELAGVPVLTVDPRNTSRECPRCGHIDKRNRPSQAVFRCVGCGHHGHADLIAAENISRRAATGQPHVPTSRSMDEPSGRRYASPSA